MNQKPEQSHMKHTLTKNIKKKHEKRTPSMNARCDSFTNGALLNVSKVWNSVVSWWFAHLHPGPVGALLWHIPTTAWGLQILSSLVTLLYRIIYHIFLFPADFNFCCM